MTGAAKSKPAEWTQRLSPELVKARRLCEKRWSPPKALSVSVLKQAPRLPLMDVLNFLAFGAPAPPKKISPLMRRARWEQSFKALCAAARDDKVKLFGRSSAEGSSQPIDPPEFDSPFWFDDEQGTIGVDLAAFATKQFARAWRDVRVERESLERWVAEELAATNAVSKGASVGRPSPMSDIEAELGGWIAGGPDRIRAEIRRWTPNESAFSKARLARALAGWAAKAKGVVDIKAAAI